MPNDLANDSPSEAEQMRQMLGIAQPMVHPMVPTVEPTAPAVPPPEFGATPRDVARVLQMHSAPEGETVVSPAISYNGNIYEGYHHGDATERAARATGDSWETIAGKADEGFTTSDGRFVSRVEAGKIDDAAHGIASEYYLTEQRQ